MTLQNFTLGTFSQGAAGAAGSFESIASASGTGSSGTISFTSIPSTYQHLQLRCFGNGDATGYGFIRFNNDSGTNYARHTLQGDGSTVAASGAASTNNSRVFEVISSTFNGKTGAIIDIHDYASTAKNKTVRSFSGWDNNTTGYVYLNSVLWVNTAAVNRIDLVLEGTVKFATNMTIDLYGIKGA